MYYYVLLFQDSCEKEDKSKSEKDFKEHSYARLKGSDKLGSTVRTDKSKPIATSSNDKKHMSEISTRSVSRHVNKPSLRETHTSEKLEHSSNSQLDHSTSEKTKQKSVNNEQTGVGAKRFDSQIDIEVSSRRRHFRNRTEGSATNDTDSNKMDESSNMLLARRTRGRSSSPLVGVSQSKSLKIISSDKKTISKSNTGLPKLKPEVDANGNPKCTIQSMDSKPVVDLQNEGVKLNQTTVKETATCSGISPKDLKSVSIVTEKCDFLAIKGLSNQKIKISTDVRIAAEKSLSQKTSLNKRGRPFSRKKLRIMGSILAHKSERGRHRKPLSPRLLRSVSSNVQSSDNTRANVRDVSSDVHVPQGSSSDLIGTSNLVEEDSNQLSTGRPRGRPRSLHMLNQGAIAKRPRGRPFSKNKLNIGDRAGLDKPNRRKIEVNTSLYLPLRRRGARRYTTLRTVPNLKEAETEDSAGITHQTKPDTTPFSSTNISVGLRRPRGRPFSKTIPREVSRLAHPLVGDLDTQSENAPSSTQSENEETTSESMSEMSELSYDTPDSVSDQRMLSERKLSSRWIGQRGKYGIGRARRSSNRQSDSEESPVRVTRSKDRPKSTRSGKVWKEEQIQQDDSPIFKKRRIQKTVKSNEKMISDKSHTASENKLDSHSTSFEQSDSSNLHPKSELEIVSSVENIMKTEVKDALTENVSDTDEQNETARKVKEDSEEKCDTDVIKDNKSDVKVQPYEVQSKQNSRDVNQDMEKMKDDEQHLEHGAEDMIKGDQDIKGGVQDGYVNPDMRNSDQFQKNGMQNTKDDEQDGYQGMRDDNEDIGESDGVTKDVDEDVTKNDKVMEDGATKDMNKIDEERKVDNLDIEFSEQGVRDSDKDMTVDKKDTKDTTQEGDQYKRDVDQQVENGDHDMKDESHMNVKTGADKVSEDSEVMSKNMERYADTQDGANVNKMELSEDIDKDNKIDRDSLYHISKSENTSAGSAKQTITKCSEQVSEDLIKCKHEITEAGDNISEEDSDEKPQVIIFTDSSRVDQITIVPSSVDDECETCESDPSQIASKPESSGSENISSNVETNNATNIGCASNDPLKPRECADSNEKKDESSSDENTTQNSSNKKQRHFMDVFLEATAAGESSSESKSDSCESDSEQKKSSNRKTLNKKAFSQMMAATKEDMRKSPIAMLLRPQSEISKHKLETNKSKVSSAIPEVKSIKYSEDKSNIAQPEMVLPEPEEGKVNTAKNQNECEKSLVLNGADKTTVVDERQMESESKPTGESISQKSTVSEADENVDIDHGVEMQENESANKCSPDADPTIDSTVGSTTESGPSSNNSDESANKDESVHDEVKTDDLADVSLQSDVSSEYFDVPEIIDDDTHQVMTQEMGTEPEDTNPVITQEISTKTVQSSYDNTKENNLDSESHKLEAAAEESPIINEETSNQQNITAPIESIDNEISLPKDEANNTQEDISIEKGEILFQEEISIEKEDIVGERENISIEKEDISIEKKEISIENKEMSTQKEEISIQKKELVSETEEFSSEKEEISILGKCSIEELDSEVNSTLSQKNDSGNDNHIKPSDLLSSSDLDRQCGSLTGLSMTSSEKPVQHQETIEEECSKQENEDKHIFDLNVDEYSQTNQLLVCSDHKQLIKQPEDLISVTNDSKSDKVRHEFNQDDEERVAEEEDIVVKEVASSKTVEEPTESAHSTEGTASTSEVLSVKPAETCIKHDDPTTKSEQEDVDLEVDDSIMKVDTEVTPAKEGNVMGEQKRSDLPEIAKTMDEDVLQSKNTQSQNTVVTDNSSEKSTVADGVSSTILTMPSSKKIVTVGGTCTDKVVEKQNSSPLIWKPDRMKTRGKRSHLVFALKSERRKRKEKQEAMADSSSRKCTMQEMIAKCKPCSIVLIDFVKYLDLNNSPEQLAAISAGSSLSVEGLQDECYQGNDAMATTDEEDCEDVQPPVKKVRSQSLSDYEKEFLKFSSGNGLKNEGNDKKITKDVESEMRAVEEDIGDEKQTENATIPEDVSLLSRDGDRISSNIDGQSIGKVVGEDSVKSNTVNDHSAANRPQSQYKIHPPSRPKTRSISKPGETQPAAAETVPDVPKSKDEVSTYSSYVACKFKCCHCVYVTNSRTVMAEHIYNHTDVVPYKCGICGAIFGTRSGILIHHRREHGTQQSPHIIKDTSINPEEHYIVKHEVRRVFTTSPKFNKVQHVSEEPRIAPRPTAKSTPPSELSPSDEQTSQAQKRKRIVMPVEEDTDPNALYYQCKHCTYSSNNQQNIEKHITSAHREDRRFVCPLCDLVYYRFESEMKRHFMRKHPSQPVIIKMDTDYYPVTKKQRKSSEEEASLTNENKNNSSLKLVLRASTVASSSGGCKVQYSIASNSASSSSGSEKPSVGTHLPVASDSSSSSRSSTPVVRGDLAVSLDDFSSVSSIMSNVNAGNLMEPQTSQGSRSPSPSPIILKVPSFARRMASSPIQGQQKVTASTARSPENDKVM